MFGNLKEMRLNNLIKKFYKKAPKHSFCYIFLSHFEKYLKVPAIFEAII